MAWLHTGEFYALSSNKGAGTSTYMHPYRVTDDHGCRPVVQILSKFSPNNQNQPVAGYSVFGFCRRRKFFGIWGLRSRLGLPVATRPSGRDQSSFDPNGSSGCACCPSFVLFDIPFNGLEVLASLNARTPHPGSWIGIIHASWSAVVSFFEPFRHNFAENGPQELKMVQKDVSSNSTQSVIKIRP